MTVDTLGSFTKGVFKFWRISTLPNFIVRWPTKAQVNELVVHVGTCSSIKLEVQVSNSFESISTQLTKLLCERVFSAENVKVISEGQRATFVNGCLRPVFKLWFTITLIADEQSFFDLISIQYKEYLAQKTSNSVLANGTCLTVVTF